MEDQCYEPPQTGFWNKFATPEADKKSALEGLKKIPLDVLRKWLTGLGDKAMPNQEAVLDLIRTALTFAA